MSSSPQSGTRILRLGIAGLGRGFAVMLPTFMRDPRVKLVAAADPRAEARQRFTADFGGHAYGTRAARARAPDVEVVYVATPHQHHAEQTCLAAAAGKHVLVEKPMTLTLADAEGMIAAARSAAVLLTG